MKIHVALGRGVKYCDRVGTSVCLSSRISQKPHAQMSRNILCMLIEAVARSSFNDNAMRYELRVLWMTLCFYKIKDDM